MQTDAHVRPYVLSEEDGKDINFLGARMLTKADAQDTGGKFCFFDQRVPPGYAVPRHIHHDEDEAWYILEGDVTFYCGDDAFTAGKGAWVFLPHGIPHTFKAGPAGARLLTMTAPGGFADFVAEVGHLASEEETEQAPAPPDEAALAKLGEIAARHGIELIGPPPA
jgi:quercetin dioxygenase-like cupin family protein